MEEKVQALKSLKKKFDLLEEIQESLFTITLELTGEGLQDGRTFDFMYNSMYEAEELLEVLNETK